MTRAQPDPRALTGMDGKHACPSPACPRRLPRGVLACRPHWYQLPPELRQRINSAWRRRDHAAHLEARREAVSFWTGDPQ